MTTWFITGCSTGLGRAFAEAVLDARVQRGRHRSRRRAKVQDLADANPDTALALPLDVTDDGQVAAAVQRRRSASAAIDVLVNNAGYGYRAAVEEGDDADVRQLFETHFFGTVAPDQGGAARDARPPRRRDRQRLLHRRPHRARPGSGYYAAVKAALEALTRSLRKEVARWASPPWSSSPAASAPTSPAAR